MQKHYGLLHFVVWLLNISAVVAAFVGALLGWKEVAMYIGGYEYGPWMMFKDFGSRAGAGILIGLLLFTAAELLVVLVSIERNTRGRGHTGLPNAQ